MKNILLILCALLFSFGLQAQDKNIKTVTLNVKGNCEECKKRIENAADIGGVKLAVWDEKKQTVTVTYRTDKVSQEQIEKAIVASGHDVNGLTADQKSYNKLPKCCQYRSNKCEEGKK